MRIGFIDVTATVSYGGVQTAVWQLARVLASRGHVITVYGGDGEIRPLSTTCGVEVRTFQFVPRERVIDLGSRFQRMVERWTFSRHARRAVIDAGHDWLVLTKPFDFFWPRLMPASSSTRFLFMSGGTDFYRGDRWLAQRVHTWCACSHFNAWQISHRYKRFPAVIYNGVDIDAFNPVRRDERLRESLGASEGDVVFAFAGRLVGWKGLRVAIEALALMQPNAPATKLWIIGNGPERDALEQLARARAVGDRVRFVDAVAHAELPRYYASCDVAIAPSIGDEAFGITIAEAMACARPVIASHIGGIPEVVGNEGSCGVLVPAGRVQEWARAMFEVAADRVRARAMGQAARARVERLFTWEAVATRLAQAMESAS